MPRAKLGVIAVVTILAVVVILQNTAAVETRVLFVTVTMPRAVLLVLALAVGFVLGLLFSFTSTRTKDPSP